MSAVERVYRDIRASIISGEYEPGSPLRLQDLTDAHGVSLIPIREALRRLEAERLVDATPNKGARVADISVADVEDAYATRIILEEEAIRRGWSSLLQMDLSGLWEVREEMLNAYARQEYARASAAHRQLHVSLYAAARSEWLGHLIELLWSHTERCRRVALSLRPSLDPQTDLHGELLDAVSRGDLDDALDSLRRDLSRTAELVCTRYRAGRPAPRDGQELTSLPGTG